MNIPNARERILNTAVRIFAEKSYEGSRIDEIAREANVPKSLIYYHFKSKEDIFRVLVDNFIKEYLELIEDTTSESHQEKAEELPLRMKNRYYEFGRRNEDLVRVILIDSLKKTQEKPVLFQIIDAMIKKEAANKQEGHNKQEEHNKQEGYNALEGHNIQEEHSIQEGYDIQERRIAEFFTAFMPNYAYICFADAWVKYFDIDRMEFDRLYLKTYEETHGAYHKNHE